MSVRPLVPQAGRDNMAIRVTVRLFEIIATTIPGASFSSIGRVASGVTSRGENPVPPVVRTSESLCTSAQSLRTACIAVSYTHLTLPTILLV